jgi:subfamily B ATP-binding cassette protein MsbA
MTDAMGEKTAKIDMKVFHSSTEVDRVADNLTGRDLSFSEIIPRIVKEHLIPMWPYLLLSYGAGLVVSVSTGAIPFLIQITSDKIVVDKDMSSLSIIPFAVVAVMVLKSAAEYLSAVSQAYISGRMDIGLKKQTYAKMLNADLAWLQQVQSGRLVSNIIGDTGRIAMTSGITLVTLGKSLITAVMLLATMIYMDPLLSAATLVGLPLVLVFLRKQRKHNRRRTKRQMQESGDLMHIIVQSLRGVRDVKAFGAEAIEVDRVTSSLERNFVFAMQTTRTQSASGPITQSLAGIGMALAIWYGGYRGITGTMTPGEFMGFVTAAMLLYPPLKQVAALQTVLAGGMAAASRVFPIMDNIPQVGDRPDAKPLEDPHGEVNFDSVSFSYDGTKSALKDISFTIDAGERVAFVGPSGAGKSTVFNLIMRFYEATSGTVKIDKQDVSEVTLGSVRGASALVSQEPFLFDDTIRANIAYGAPDVSLDEIKEAAEMAAAHEFIMQLPEGYDTTVGEAGNRLSGGQKQRISLARAILSRAPILLLDEPTSALDVGTEAAIEKVLKERMAGRTVVMIAHRMSTVRRADRIFVLEEGKLVEEGTHESLLENNGVYARMHGVRANIAS